MSTALLIQYGHDLSDIANYTLNQFVTFVDAAERLRAAARQAFTNDVALAASAMMSKGDALKDHLNSLHLDSIGE